MSKDQSIGELSERDREFCRRFLTAVYCPLGNIDREYTVDYSKALLDTLEECLAELPSTSEAMLTIMFREGKTREEAAAQLGVADPEYDEAQEPIRSDSARGIRMLRHPSRSKRFRQFLTPLQQPEDTPEPDAPA